MLRGWVAYFAVGNSSECFGFINKDWVETKIRRHMARARNRKGFGWKRWSTQWLYTKSEDKTCQKLSKHWCDL
jgi:RNA-directed DNA polymerase